MATDMCQVHCATMRSWRHLAFRCTMRPYLLHVNNQVSSLHLRSSRQSHKWDYKGESKCCLQRRCGTAARLSCHSGSSGDEAVVIHESPVVEMKCSQHNLEGNAKLCRAIKNKLILGPLTRGGNLPFRRLCADFGADVSMSEMVFSRMVLQGKRAELARLKRADNEILYGVQIAAKSADEGVAAGLLAVEHGADWIDLNCGCPIHEATRRGLGSELLRKPNKLAKLVNMLSERLPVPVSVKIRTGISTSRINAEKVVELLENAGAAFVTIHGRTSQQGYKKLADWDLMENIAKQRSVPVVGNGDILTYYEADARLKESGCHALMAARGALIKPWIFQEYKEKRELLLTIRERIEIYRRLVMYMKEHFLDDDRGKRMAFYFLPWHFNFLCRYRHLPEELYGSQAKDHPLLQTRFPDLGSPVEQIVSSFVAKEAGDECLLSRLLACESDAAFVAISEVLWESESDSAAVLGLEKIAVENLVVWEQEKRSQGRTDATAEG